MNLRSILHLCLSGLIFISIFGSPVWASPTPDIRTIPRLRAGLEPGTIAWATVDQLHPTQPQTGKREVKRKREKFEDMQKRGEFSQQLFEYLYNEGLSPVYIGVPLAGDSRENEMSELGYLVDRTHGSNALADLYVKLYGRKSLHDPIYDSDGRPLNYVLVKVQGDLSKKSSTDFVHYMVENRFCYLKLWKRRDGGGTRIRDIAFSDLPETVYQTTDNPYRSLIGALQHEHELGRSSVDFSQFVDAEALIHEHIVEWDDISKKASDESFHKALKRADDFFESKQARNLPGVEVKCHKLFQ